MKRIYMMMLTILLSLSLSACVSADEMNELMESSREESLNDVGDKNEQDKEVSNSDSSEEDTTETEIQYKVEPKEIYDPNNKKPKMDFYYGYTYEQDKYLTDICEKETESTKFMTKYRNYKPESMNIDNIYEIGEEVPLVEHNAVFILNDVQLYDSIATLDKQYFIDESYYNCDFISKDGTINKSNRHVISGKDENIKEVDEETQLKFVVLDMTVIGKANWVEELAINQLCIVPTVNTEKGCVQAEHDLNINYEVLEISKPCYYDNPLFVKNNVRSHYFFNYIGKDEVHNFELGYYVDERHLDNLYLVTFSSTSHNLIWTDSIVQKYVKLFS